VDWGGGESKSWDMIFKYYYLNNVKKTSATKRREQQKQNRNCRLIELTIPAGPPEEGAQHQQKTCGNS
jgi:hypothetical protein